MHKSSVERKEYEITDKKQNKQICIPIPSFNTLSKTDNIYIAVNNKQMTQQLTSPSHCSSSIDENLLRLNSSSCCLVSPSQSNFSSNLKNNLIHFEEYSCKQENAPLNIHLSVPVVQNNKKTFTQPSISSVGVGKKKLTIQIDENYDSPNSMQQPEKMDKFQKNQRLQKIKPKLSEDFQQASSSIDGIELISPIQNKNFIKNYELQEKIKEYQKINQSSLEIIKHLQAQCDQKQERARGLSEKLYEVEAELQAKKIELGFKSNKIQLYQTKIKQKEQEINIMRQQNIQKQRQKQKYRQKYQEMKQFQFSPGLLTQIEQKMKEKDSKLRELSKINQKLKNLNKDLIKQVKASDKKVRDLEKQLQNYLCLATQENIHRLKESSIKNKQKQNIQRYNGTYSHSHNTKTERDMPSCQQNSIKQKQTSFTLLASNTGTRKSLERKKNGPNPPNPKSESMGQLTKKPGSIKTGNSSSSNTILTKKLLHK